MTLNPEHRNIVTSIVRSAEINIMLQTDMDVELVLTVRQRKLPGEVQELMGVIAQSIGCTMDDYFGGRQRKYVDLRCLACTFIRKYYPDVPLVKIGAYMGDMDHTSVIHNRNRALAYLKTGEETFTQKYSLCIIGIQKWLGELNITVDEQ